MKFIQRNVTLNQPGSVKLIPEEPDDLWLIYNLISTGDTISAFSSRKIYLSSNSDDSSAPKKNNPVRVKIELHIKITAVDYNKNSSAIRVKGKSLFSNEHVKAGAFHTLEIENNKEFNLAKQNWDEDSINSLTEASNRTNGSDVAVVLMHEGLAHIFSVGKTLTTTLFSIDRKIGANKFFETLFSAFNKHVDFDSVKCVVIGSPGSIKNEFRLYLLSESHKLKIKSIENNKSRIVLVDTSSGNKSALKEVLNDVKVRNLIKNTESTIEIRLFNEFRDMLSSNSDRACYGLKNVDMALELMAIETLMITEELFRNSEISTKQKYIGIVKLVKEAGGKVAVLPTGNMSGEELAKLTGIANYFEISVA